MTGEGNRTERPEHAVEQLPNMPRVYVADLASYNNGYLHGEWINANQEAEQMWEEISAMLARSPVPGAEEIAIHDFDNFGPLYLSEYESIETVARIGRGVAEHGEAFLHWVSYVGTADREGIERFEDALLGQYESIRELGEELACSDEIDRLIEEHLPEFIRPHVTVDYEGFGRDVASSCHVAEGDGAVYVFDPT